MKQKLTIEVEVKDGYELRFDPETMTVQEIKKDPRSKSWEEFCKSHPSSKGEWYFTARGGVWQVNEASKRSLFNTLPTREDAEGVQALIRLIHLRKEWVSDWAPNPKVYQDTACILMSHDGHPHVSVLEPDYGPRFLSFPSIGLAGEFLMAHRELIEQAGKLLMWCREDSV